jgi:hypothetical protein
MSARKRKPLYGSTPMGCAGSLRRLIGRNARRRAALARGSGAGRPHIVLLREDGLEQTITHEAPWQAVAVVAAGLRERVPSWPVMPGAVDAKQTSERETAERERLQEATT